jgi:beta-glucosidase
MIYTEFEKNTDALLIHFGVQDQALLDLISGEVEPNGLLPLQMPADMETVEKQFEDLPHDLDCYVDTQGHRYDFAFGLNWKGEINDERKSKYKK